MLPEEWDYCKVGSSNQNIFRIQLKRKNHPPKFKTIMKKNLLVWAAGYASGRSRRAGFNYLARTGFELHSTTAAKKDFQIFQTERASDRQRRGWRFCWSGGGSALPGNAQKQVFVFRFFQSVASDTKQTVFNPTLYGLGA
ncbi:MAG: hypothetical protein U5L95_01165 [Candidatus Saccharibacteria bacterium]|nr:hypothetical protein [Candidatus Saccharibacteria bacterium]